MFDRFKSKDANQSLFAHMAPMADVVFLLLIFFMITSSFVMEPGIDIKLPRAITAEEQIELKHVLTITEDRTVLLDQKVTSFSKLKRMLEDAYSGKDAKLLIIRADKNVPHGLVVKALDISREAGVPQLAIATERIE
jgi:biopolymer transport protein ExbD